MTFKLPDLNTLSHLPFDEVIDVRSPAEFGEDHLPGAINLPVLSDDERAQVGTIYVQDSPFKARKIGAALVARNAAHHLERHFADKPASYAPLIYCWRGGQRSGALCTILKQIGWRARTLEGGYRTYRRAVSDALYERPFASPVILLDGNTGTAKTDMLLQLQALGVQMIDLEGLANHRGSLFGARAGGQPSQKGFETRLAIVTAALDSSRPVIVEAESIRIGQCKVPPSLWAAMKDAPGIRLEADLKHRAKYLVSAYGDITEDVERLEDIIERMRPFHAGEVITDWLDFAASGQVEELATQLMASHYDPRYAKQRARSDHSSEHVVALSDLTPDSLEQAAQALLPVIEQLARGDQQT